MGKIYAEVSTFSLMEDSGTLFLPSLTANPLVLWSILSQEACADENGVLSAGRVMDEQTGLLHLSGIATILPRGKQLFKFARQTRRQTREHCSATSQHYVLDEWDEVINFICFKTLIELLSKSCILNTSKLGIKHALCSLEALTTYFDYLVIRQFVLLIKQSRLVSKFSVLDRVVGDKALGFLQLTNGLKVR